MSLDKRLLVRMGRLLEKYEIERFVGFFTDVVV